MTGYPTLWKMLGLVMVFAAATALATENPLPRVDDLAGAKWSRARISGSPFWM